MPRPDCQGCLLDLSGTLYEGDVAVDGAVEAVERLRRAGLSVACLTNTTSQPRSKVWEKLRKIGLELPAAGILTAPVAACRQLGKRGFRRCRLLVPEPVLEDFPGIEAVEDAPEAVVVGDIGQAFSYAVLNRAFEQLMDGAAFFALARNRYFTGGDRLRLDVGPFVAALEYATGREAELIGKPAKSFFEAGASILGLEPERIVLVGDDVEGDVGGALNAGMAGALVRTGKFMESALRDSDVEPTAVLDSIADLPDWLGIE